MSIESKFTHGQEVVVSDRHGNYECRGKVVGIHRCNPTVYDVQPNREKSLARRVCGVTESQLRPVSKPILAYERMEINPERIKEEA